MQLLLSSKGDPERGASLGKPGVWAAREVCRCFSDAGYYARVLCSLSVPLA